MNNIDKSQQLRENSDKKEMHKPDDSGNNNYNKPNMMKKKPKLNDFQEDKKNEMYERVWKDEDNEQK